MVRQNTVTRTQLRAARALTATSIKTVSDAAGIHSAIISDFERGFQPSLGDRSQHVVDFFTGLGVGFSTDGSTSLEGAGPTPSRTRGSPYRWIEATDLAAWGASRDGQEGMPELVGRLILSTVGPSVVLRFPSGDSVQFAGWDGVCIAAAGGDRVPSGNSVWELGAQRENIRGKADDDYEKRTTGPTSIDREQTTYLFVTPQRWPAKAKWMEERCSEDVWKDVIAIDGDDLVHWLDICPGVVAWLSARIGKRPDSVRTLQQAFDEWSFATEPPLPLDLLVVDREDEATGVLQWLYGEPSVRTLQAESAEEAIAFLHAVIDPLPPTHRLYWETCILVTGTEEAGRKLLDLSAKLVIIIEGVNHGLAQTLSAQGHHVFVAHGSDVITPPGAPVLSRPWRHSIQRSLEATGLDRRRAEGLARDCGRSISVLRRIMPSGGGRLPTWATNPMNQSLLAALLAGSWVSQHPVDRRILERLAARDYATIESELAGFLSMIDGPVRHSGGVWKLASLRDAWLLIGGNLTQRHVDALFESLREILGDDDPTFDGDRQNRWQIPDREPSRASSQLRRGLAEAATALAVFPERVSAVAAAKFRSATFVKELLSNAGERRWWSLASDFRRLAEMAPQEFLEGLRDGLAADPSPLQALFRSDEGFIHPTEYLADLMWALEALAWSPDYLAAVALCLARLDEMDPGGTMSNRPSGTLRRIFLPWHPQTYATLAERLEVIDAIVERHPTVGWKLLVALAPDNFLTTSPSAMPAWRDFPSNDEPSPTDLSLANNYAEIGKRLVCEAGKDFERWSVLLGEWHEFDQTWRDQARAALVIAIDSFNSKQMDAFRETMRQTIGKHEQFPDAEWTLKQDEIEALKAIFRALEPSDSATRHAWLFGGPRFTFRQNFDWQQDRIDHEAQQRAAVEDIAVDGGNDALLALVEIVRLPRDLGQAVASSSIADEDKDRLLEVGLGRHDGKWCDFVRGMLRPLKAVRGDAWLLAFLRKNVASGSSVERSLKLALALVPNADNWSAIAGLGPKLERAYWAAIGEFAIPHTAEASFVRGKLLSVGRAPDAITWLGAHPKIPMPSADVVEILCHPSAFSGSTSQAPVMEQHYVCALFKRLDDDPLVAKDEIAALEWRYYQMLEHSERPARNLDRALAENPALFVRLISSAYMPDNASETERAIELSEQEKVVARQSYRVLSNWRVIPGSDVSGMIDGAKLDSWIAEARRLAVDHRRIEVVEARIGKVLAVAPREEGLPWPPPEVRRVIESSASDELGHAFFVACRNLRGITVRRPTEGGDQERSLAEFYRSAAKTIGAANVRTRAILNKLAQYYADEGDFEDRSADQRDW